MSPRRRVAILGGGAGSLAAAYWLSREGWKSDFESITVYQRGWRLGGKGASGRGAHDRIEEHGLHVWFGFYDNAFRTLRGCYEELDRPASVPIRTIEEAFQPASTFVLTERLDRGWVPWTATFPMTSGVPGDTTEPGRQPPSMPELLERALELLAAELRSVRTPRHPTVAPRSDVWLEPMTPADQGVRLEQVPSAGVPAAGGVRRLASAVIHGLQSLPLQLAEEAFAAALLIATSMRREDVVTPANPEQKMAGLVERGAGIVTRHLRPLLDGSDSLRRQWYLVDLVLACVRGVLADGLLTSGVDGVDDVEFVDWLVRHGAEEESARSALVTAVVYDLAFAYRHGDPAEPACSTATALRGLARVFFGYRGAIAYKMQAGMGDTVFAPLYELLRRRGVRFEFFCDVQQLHLSEDNRSIGSISLSRQLRLRHTVSEYEPLIDVGGLPCWPAEPRWDQLEPAPGLEADELEKMCSPQTADTFTLRAGEDFDVVVLGIGVGALSTICRPLVEHDPTWQAMIEGLGTVWTQALQLWLSKSPGELGGLPPGAIAGGFLEPFDTYADMSHLIERESWDGQVAGIAYFCSVLPTPRGDPAEHAHATIAAQATEDVRRNAVRFLQHGMADLLPGATRRYPADFRWDLLVGDAPAGLDPAQLRTQYWRANVDPSDRYVQSLPGTSRLRKAPSDSGFGNLVLAGDWTDCGLNAGCVEAAVTSGMLAAHALLGRPRLDEISGIAHLAGQDGGQARQTHHTRLPQEATS